LGSIQARRRDRCEQAARQGGPSGPTPTLNRVGSRLEISMIACEVPVLSKRVELVDLICAGEVVRQVCWTPRRSRFQGYDRIDFPAFKQLHRGLYAGNGVS